MGALNKTNTARLTDLSFSTADAQGQRLEHRFIVRREDQFDFAGQDYSDLYSTSSATAFQHPVWLTALYNRLAPARGAEKIVVTLRSAADGSLTGVIPLIRRRISGVLLVESTDLGVSDYAAPVIAPASLDGIKRGAGLREAVTAALPHYDVLRVRPIREEALDDWRMLLPGSIGSLDFSAHATLHGTDHAGWRAAKPRKSLLKRLDRAYKAIAKQGGHEMRRLAGDAEIREAIDLIQRLRAGRFEGDPIQQDYVREFYREVAVNGADDIAAIHELSIGGAPAAYAFGLTNRGCFHYLLIGCDYENFSRLAPGLVFYDRLIADWAGRGGEVFDFTIGDEPFKADYGTEPTRMFTLTHAPGWRGQLAFAALRTREQLRGLARRIKPG